VKLTQRTLAFLFGIAFLLLFLVLAKWFPYPTALQYFVFRLLLSLAAAGVAAVTPGFLHLRIPTWSRAGGALAVFVLLYSFNPASLVAYPPIEPGLPNPTPRPTWTFPAEPPHPTTFTQVPDKLLRRPGTETLGSLAARMEAALADAGYVGVKYLAFLDDGFAVITPMEGIASDRRPRSDAGRWAVKSPPLFSLHDYLEALLHARHGLYRVWVFTLTTHPYRFGPLESTAQRLNSIYGVGTTGLPLGIAKAPFLDGYRCFALAYEFERLEQPPQPSFVTASDILADKQLLASGIVRALARR
jgi:hypothetical protein